MGARTPAEIAASLRAAIDEGTAVFAQADDARTTVPSRPGGWCAREPWRDLVALWTAYNRHLAHVMASTPEDAAARALRAPGGAGEVTIAFLMEDYVRHLRHHLAQATSLLAR